MEQSAGTRMMAAAPKQTLDQYVESIRNQIADAYGERVEKYDGYVAAFQKFVATDGLPRAADFASVKVFAKKRAEMLKKVGFPDDWQVRGPEADKIREMLKEIPAARKEGGANAPWYAALTDAQVSDCAKDPQLFVELSKLNAFEEQFALASKAQATKFGLPVVTLDELPATMDPVEENTTVSAKEVKWIMQSARQQAESLRKSDPAFSDPYSTPEFAKAQEVIADRLGMSPEQLKKAQESMTSAKWRETCADAGIAL